MKLIELLAGFALLCMLLGSGAQVFAGINRKADTALEKIRVVSDGYELADGSVGLPASRFLKSASVTDVRIETKKSKTGQSYEILSCDLFGKELLVYRGLGK